MRKMSLLSVASFVLAGVAGVLLHAQEPESGMRAPDGGTQEWIASIYIPPVTNAPFQATVTLEWTKHLADGSTKVVKNHRLVVRDSEGNIYQERRMLVPDGSTEEPQVRLIEISSPAKHTKYFCTPKLTMCQLRDYYDQATEPVVVTPPADKEGKRTVTRTDLGKKQIEGVDAIGTRETTTIQAGVVGNSARLESSKEFWYSAELGLNLRVLRLDPLHGDQSLAVTELRLSAPDPQMFVLPTNCKVTDMRRSQHPQETAATN